MKISDSSSPASITTPASPRNRYRLTGPTVPLEPGRFAIRRDLAEIAVADRVFAQHYAEPMVFAAVTAADVLVQPRADSAVVGVLARGENFYLLDAGIDWAWGRFAGGVGYIACAAIDVCP